jgi:hypothetical protein
MKSICSKMTSIDIKFNVFSDTPKGKDPDSFSPTLRKYHQKLWSKKLPNGISFDLTLEHPRVLYHSSELGEFILSSDAIGHTYKGVKRMSHIVDQLPVNELDTFFEFERNIIRKRQAEGIAKAKERGVYENRIRKTTIDRNEVKRLKSEGLSTYKIADAMKISRMSVHRILNQSA